MEAIQYTSTKMQLKKKIVEASWDGRINKYKGQLRDSYIIANRKMYPTAYFQVTGFHKQAFIWPKKSVGETGWVWAGDFR